MSIGAFGDTSWTQPMPEPDKTPCDCGQGVIMWNEKGHHCCSATLEKYKMIHGVYPESGGEWSHIKPSLNQGGCR